MGKVTTTDRVAAKSWARYSAAWKRHQKNRDSLKAKNDLLAAAEVDHEIE